MNYLIQIVKDHQTVILSAMGALFVSFVSHMPENPPKSFVDVYQWIRNTLQTVLPIKAK